MGKLSEALYQELKDDLFHYLSDTVYVADFAAESLDGVSVTQIRDTVFSQGTGNLSIGWAYANLSHEPGFQTPDGKPQYTAQQFQDFVFRLQNERPGILYDDKDRNIWHYTLTRYGINPSNVPQLLDPAQAYEFLTTRYGTVGLFSDRIKLIDPSRIGDTELLFNQLEGDLSGDDENRKKARQFLDEFDQLFLQCGQLQMRNGYKEVVALSGHETNMGEFTSEFQQICKKYGYTIDDIALARARDY